MTFITNITISRSTAAAAGNWSIHVGSGSDGASCRKYISFLSPPELAGMRFRIIKQSSKLAIVPSPPSLSCRTMNNAACVQKYSWYCESPSDPKEHLSENFAHVLLLGMRMVLFRGNRSSVFFREPLGSTFRACSAWC